MTIKVKRLFDCNLPLPEFHTVGASGFDLRSNEPRAVEVGPGSHATFKTGFAYEVPAGFELQVRPRSGLSSRHNVVVQFGTVDSDYRGELKLTLVNHSRTSHVIEPGDRIAQGVVMAVPRIELKEVESLNTTPRGSKGYGSTGFK